MGEIPFTIPAGPRARARRRRAGDLADQLGVRGYDAVHLAAAETLADPDLVVVAGDSRLCDAATALGLAVART